MSIEVATPANSMGSSEEHRSKDAKKHKSSHGEKKRKRDPTTKAPRTKSKKHRVEKQEEDEIEKDSPFQMQTASLYLPLAPISQKFPLEGLCAEHLSPLILTYYPPLSGVILSYHDPRVSEAPYQSDNPSEWKFQNIDEYAVSWTWTTAEFLLFKPVPGVELEGYVNLQSQGHLGVVCWNLFNASIEAKRLPKSWKWVDIEHIEKEDGNEGYAEDGGHWVDGNGEKIDGNIKFRVFEVDSSADKEKGFLSIEGTMLNSKEEAELVEQLGDTTDQSTSRGAMKIGATILGVPAEVDPLASSDGKKHRRKY